METEKIFISRYFWLGILIVLVLTAALNAVPYFLTRGDYAGDGLEIVGFPFVFHSIGGFGGESKFYWLAFSGDVLLGLCGAFCGGYLLAGRLGIIKLILGVIIVTLTFSYLRYLTETVYWNQDPDLIFITIILSILIFLAACIKPSKLIGPLVITGIAIVSIICVWAKIAKYTHWPIIGWQFFLCLFIFGIAFFISSWCFNWLFIRLHIGFNKKSGST